MRRTIQLVAALVATSIGSEARGETIPVAVDLGTLGGPMSSATDLNWSGHVVGYSDLPDGTTHAFSWTHERGMIDLGTLGGAFSAASAVNLWGQVVGETALSDGTTHAFSWTHAGGLVDIGVLDANRPYSSAVRVNDRGQVVGYSHRMNREWLDENPCGAMRSHCIRTFLWSRLEGMQDIGVIGHLADDWVYPLGFSNAGQIVGWEMDDSVIFPYSWTDAGGMVNVGFFPGGGPWAWAKAVNERGQVVGYASVSPSDSARHAFLWTQATGKRDLGTLWADGSLLEFLDDSRAYAINDLGQVVGSSDGPLGRQAFLWSESSGMIDLGHGAAVAISNRGQVIGNGHDWDSIYYSATPDTRAFSWTEQGGRIDLGPGRAVALNENGQAVGFRTVADGTVHAVLWKTDPRAELLLLAGATVRELPPSTTRASLLLKLVASGAALSFRPSSACDPLMNFIREATAQIGRNLTLVQVKPLVARARDIRTMLQCQ